MNLRLASKKQINCIKYLVGLGYKPKYTFHYDTLNMIQASYIIKDLLNQMYIRTNGQYGVKR